MPNSPAGAAAQAALAGRAAIAAAGKRRVVLVGDFNTSTQFLAGIAVLVVLRRKAGSAMTPVALVCSSTVRKVLEMTGLMTMFTVFDSVEAALA